MKSTASVILALFFVLVACQKETLQGAVTKETVHTSVPVQEVVPPKEGTFVFFIKTDFSEKDMANAIGKLTVLEVSAFHKELGFWTKISSADTVLSTGEKSSEGSPYATAVVREGVYEQLRVKIGDVLVKNEGVEASPLVPFKDLKIPFSFEIKPDEETRVTVRLLFGKSLHKNGAIFAPVVEVVSGSQKQEFFINAKGVMGVEKFDVKVFEEKELPKPVREESPEEIAAQEERMAALDAAAMKISPGEKKKFVVNKQ